MLLAKAGIFVHASTSNADDVAVLPYFDTVLADIGDDQSLLASLSTFSGHIRRVTRILDAATPASLVLLDELGTGTNPAEGAALGISLLRYLAAGRARLVLATTHHGELTTLKYVTPEENGVPSPALEDEKDGAEGGGSRRRRRRTDDRFENASVEFDDVALRPTYRLIWGIPGRSHALSIAARLGCPPAIIEGARQSLTSAPRPGVIVAGGGGDGGGGSPNGTDGGSGGATPSGGATTATPHASALIESLEEQRAAAEAAAADAAAARAEAVALRDELAARAATVRAHEAELRAHQEAAFAKEVAAARSAIADVVRTMQRGGGGGGASAASAAEARAALAALEAAAARSGGGVPLPPDEAEDSAATGPPAGSVVKGDRVVVPRLGPGEVEVVDAPAGKKELTVLWGGMRAKVKHDELTGRRAAPPPTPAPASGRRGGGRGGGGGGGRSGPPLVRTAANTVDLRGQRVETALGKLDDILSRTLVLGGVWLIHGHGTGKLKRALREALDGNGLVGAWRDGASEEGGSGVTVVTFK